MLKIGLTGGIGSGKTEVSTCFAQQNIPVIDTDVIAREQVTPGSIALKEIKQHFGMSVINHDHTLDRHKLAQIVFNHPAQKTALEAILHPGIIDEIRQRLRQFTGFTPPPAYVVIVIPLLIESMKKNTREKPEENQLLQMVDRILLVDASEAAQMARVQQRDRRTPQATQQILNAQATRSERLAKADDIVHNDGDLLQLKQQVQALHRKYLQLASQTTTG